MQDFGHCVVINGAAAGKGEEMVVVVEGNGEGLVISSGKRQNQLSEPGLP